MKNLEFGTGALSHLKNNELFCIGNKRKGHAGHPRAKYGCFCGRHNTKTVVSNSDTSDEDTQRMTTSVNSSYLFPC